MSESCTLNVTNNSGRSIDSIKIWHTPVAIDGDVLKAIPPSLAGTNVANGQTLTATVPLTMSPTDYWSGGVLFEGDGTCYLLCGALGAAGKEYEVSDGSTISFVINAYTSGTTNQKNDVTIQYSGDGGGTAQLLNPDTVTALDVGEEIADLVSEAAE